ncbi:MAG: C40 family peptidase [Clostridiales bacterium]|nr:C40 family peptidase [Clostridiales bacterium]
MKNREVKHNLNLELLHRRQQRSLRRSLKMTSIVLVVASVILWWPLVPLGHASDICLQVPTEQTISLSGKSYYIPSHASSGKTSSEVSMDDILKDDTYVVTEHTDRDGNSKELLDPNAFDTRDEEVFVQVNQAQIHLQPSSESPIIATLELFSNVRRIGIGSSWSCIEFGDEEGSLTGYVLSDSLTTDVLATPTPIPTETPTPTPSPVPHESTPTPTPTPKPEADPTPVEATSTPTPSPVPEVEEYASSGEFFSLGEVNVRSGPGTSFEVLRKLERNDSVTIVAETSNGWFKLSDGGYVRADLVYSEPVQETTVETTAPRETTEATTTTEAPSDDPDEPYEPTETASSSEDTEPSDPTPTPVPFTPPTLPDPDSCDLMTYARAFIGIPYVWCGADLTGLDCSGFVSYVYAHYYHYSLPHQSAMIAELGTDVTGQELRAGDVICHDYNGDGRVDHVSLYCGDDVVIHASTSNGGIVEDWYPMSAMVTIRRFV